jgi:TolB protein
MEFAKTFRKFSVFPIAFSLVFMFAFSSCEEDTVEPETYGSISGTVLDAESNLAVSGAGITTNPPTSAVLTDNSGKFHLTDMAVGDYVISISKAGYTKGTVSVSVKEGKTSDAVILLTKSDTENNAPYAPVNASPADESLSLPLSVKLQWSGKDPDAGDTLRYDVYLYESNSTTKTKAASAITDTSYTIAGLKYNTTYMWQVIVKDQDGLSANGLTWSFKTIPQPDNRILFVSNEDGDYEIYSTNLNDTVFVKLTDNYVNDLQPRFNGLNRKKIAFTSMTDIYPYLYVMNSDGTGVTKVSSKPVTGNHNIGMGFSWSNIGDKLLYSAYDELWVVNADGTGEKLIARAPNGRTFGECGWSPNDDKIVAVTVGYASYETEIYIMNNDGSNLTLFEDRPGTLGSPSFSPDGKSLLFTYDASDYQSTIGLQLNARIYIERLDYSDTTDVSKNKISGYNDLKPRFSPDGSQIIFVNTKNDGSTKNEVWVVDVTGDNRKKLFNGYLPDWK